MERRMRAAVATLVAPVLKLTGFRFSKDYRWGVSRYHRAIYAVCDTLRANLIADGRLS
jgi:hypothetical protein